jgi:hypothetical protein
MLAQVLGLYGEILILQLTPYCARLSSSITNLTLTCKQDESDEDILKPPSSLAYCKQKLRGWMFHDQA